MLDRCLLWPYFLNHLLRHIAWKIIIINSSGALAACQAQALMFLNLPFKVSPAQDLSLCPEMAVGRNGALLAYSPSLPTLNLVLGDREMFQTFLQGQAPAQPEVFKLWSPVVPRGLPRTQRNGSAALLPLS